jgi:hypothetical protein
MRDCDAKVAAAMRDHAKRERTASLVQSKLRAQEQVARLTLHASEEASRASPRSEHSAIDAEQGVASKLGLSRAKWAQEDDGYEESTMAFTASSESVSSVHSNSNLNSNCSCCSSDSSNEVEGSGSCSELLEALRSPRKPGTAPWTRERDPKMVQAAARRIGNQAALAASASGSPKAKALAMKIVEQTAVFEARKTVNADHEEAMAFLLHEAELEALIVGGPPPTKRHEPSSPSLQPASARIRPPWVPT